MGLGAPSRALHAQPRAPPSLTHLPALPGTLSESHPPARPFGAHLKGSSAKTRGTPGIGFVCGASEGARWRQVPGRRRSCALPVGKCSSPFPPLGEKPSEGLLSPSSSFPPRFERKRRDIARGAGSCGPNPNSSVGCRTRKEDWDCSFPWLLLRPPPLPGFSRLVSGCHLPANQLRSLLRVASPVAVKMALAAGAEVFPRPLFQGRLGLEGEPLNP